MAPIKIDHVVSFSSEDPVHIANNILSKDSNKKWKCKTNGEKQAIVVLQLEKACKITAIDIGNEHSAYIEVLVSRSSNNDDYKVLLVTSAFMTPLEARQSQNVNKVRMFTQDQLSKPEQDEKWDRIKIICSQPFNKHVQYGLSFVSLHSSESKESTTPSTKIGTFTLRPESPDNLSAGNLFAKRKEFKKDEKPATAAAAIRDAASSSSRHGSPTCKPKLLNRESSLTPKRQSLNKEVPERKDRNRDELFYTEDDEKGNEKFEKIMKKRDEDELKQKEKEKDEEKIDQKRKKLFDLEDSQKNKKKKLSVEKNEKTEEKTPKKQSNLFNLKDSDKNKKKDKQPQRNHNSSSTSRSRNEDTNSERKKDTENQGLKPKTTKPFNKLLEGVVLVISGIQNPDRADLRTMALSLGAKYKTDWDHSCTHLICAFPNTPKFNQVKGKGKIVKKSWVEDCIKERKRLPWRRYALDKSDADQLESEEEIEERIDRPSVKRKVSASSIDNSDNEHIAGGSNTEDQASEVQQKNKMKDKTDKKEHKNSNKDEMERREDKGAGKEKKKQKVRRPSFANSDINEASTDEEAFPNIFKVVKNVDQAIDDPSGGCVKVDIFNADTDEEPECSKRFKNVSPNIFGGYKIYIDDKIDKEVYSKLRKYVIAYSGRCSDDIAGDIDVIITTRENSSKLKKINQNAKCAKPSWILHSLKKKEILPINDFSF